MQHLSTNATLFFKIFVPFFWTTILTGFTLVAWLSPDKTVDLPAFRWGMVFLLVVTVAFFVLIFWPLKRVEADAEHVYVSNYFRTAYYHWERDVEALHLTRILFFRVATLELNGIGSFGRKMRFLPSRKLLKQYMEQHPNLVPLVQHQAPEETSSPLL